MKLYRSLSILFFSTFFSSVAVGSAIQKLSVSENGFLGHYYQQDDDSSKQPVIVLGGSEGGIPTRLAKVVAENGFPTLAVAYFREDSLPEELERIPLEYFENARNWLQQKHPDSQHLTLVGWSKGAELSLLLASNDATYDRVVAIAPSSVVWPGILKDRQKTPDSSWTLEQKALPFVTYNPTGAITSLLDLYTQSLENRGDNGSATIKTENISGSVFLYSGGMDEIWPSSLMSEDICQRMKQNKTSTCKHLDYPYLDHLLNYKILDESEQLYRDFVSSIGSKD